MPNHLFLIWNLKLVACRPKVIPFLQLIHRNQWQRQKTEASICIVIEHLLWNVINIADVPFKHLPEWHQYGSKSFTNEIKIRVDGTLGTPWRLQDENYTILTPFRSSKRNSFRTTNNEKSKQIPRRITTWFPDNLRIGNTRFLEEIPTRISICCFF